MAVVFIIGAFLFSIHYKLPAIVSLPFAGIGLILTFFLKEPYKNSKKLNIKNSLIHLKEGLVYFWSHKYVKYLITYSVPIVVGIAMSQSVSSVYLENILIPISVIGVVAFAASMTSAFFSKKAHIIEEKIGEKKSLSLIQILTILSLFLMAAMINYYGVLFYLIIAVVYGFSEVIINHYVNIHIETSHRATMISIKNFFGNLGVFIFFPIFGYVTKLQSMSNAFIYTGIFVVVVTILLFFIQRKLKFNNKKKK